ncbi:MAG TPA: UDP-N-acetylmuramate--L-alanine ligase [Acidimicrobiia bacterium]
MTVDQDPVDLSGPRLVHIVAVGGTAMSAIARLFLQLGHVVSGSDVRDGVTLAALRREGVQVSVGHAAENVPADAAVVVHSTAVRADNPELQAARDRGIPVWRRSDAMAYLVARRPRAAVISGTHGKTTTTSMVAAILTRAGMDPSYFIGGTPSGVGTNAHFDVGDWFVVEGDESDRSVLAYRRDAVIVTNIEAEHLEHWDFQFDTLVAGFAEFVDGASTRVLCVDDPVTAQLAASRPDARTYGYAPGAHVQARDYTGRAGGAELTLVAGGEEVARLRLRLRGHDMAQNATGAATLAHELGVSWPTIVDALGDFAGVGRRFEYRNTFNGADLYDDYAHTPVEIAATLARAREGDWKRVIAVCQPHRYSRVSQHWQEYADAFVDADVVVITALDGAFEEPIAGVDAQLVVDAVRAAHPDTPLEYLPEWDALAGVPWRAARAGDVVVTLGCGTITDAHALWEREAERRGDR